MFITSQSNTTRLTMLLAVPLFLMGCAQIPRSGVTEAQFGSLSCAELAREVDAAKTSGAVAEQAKSDSWHAVLPFVVAARYADASSAATEAKRRTGLLTAQAAQRGCATEAPAASPAL